jgi:phospholipid/cholesterol/gamma-HCH transport system substrate-binding protein
VSKTQVAIRIGALVVVAVVGLSFILFDVLGYRIGSQPFAVTVYLPRGGGLYSDGFVTYRGVDVGRIQSLNLVPQGVKAVVTINPGTKIPANAIAHVHELSVAGEQYLDFVPSSADGPDLHAGSVIGERHTVVPVSVYTLLDDAGQLISSIKSSEVQTVVKSLGTGFANTGPALRSIEQAADSFVTALQKARAATLTIINGGGQILATANATDNELISFSNSLDQITQTLASSNADLQALLAKSVPTEAALNTFVQKDGTALTQLIKNLATLSDVAIQRQPAVVSLLDQLPNFVQRIAASASGGSVAVHIYYNSSQTVCPYISGADTAEPTAATGAPTLTNKCNTTAPDLLQRGAANAPVSSGG